MKIFLSMLCCRYRVFWIQNPLALLKLVSYGENLTAVNVEANIQRTKELNEGNGRRLMIWHRVTRECLIHLGGDMRADLGNRTEGLQPSQWGSLKERREITEILRWKHADGVETPQRSQHPEVDRPEVPQRMKGLRAHEVLKTFKKLFCYYILLLFWNMLRNQWEVLVETWHNCTRF